jgi:hypothetical protein
MARVLAGWRADARDAATLFSTGCCAQVPADGRLYRQKRVCETLLCLWGTCHSDPALLPPDAQGATATAAAGDGLDASIAQVLCQAVRLPGLAGHLVRTAGLLPWLAASAVARVRSSPSAGSHNGGSWARDALRHLAGGGGSGRRQAVHQACELAGLLKQRGGLVSGGGGFEV